MTGNKISNLSKAVESFTKHPTNMTHYQVFLIIVIFSFNIMMVINTQDIKRLVLTSNSIGHFSHACLPPR